MLVTVPSVPSHPLLLHHVLDQVHGEGEDDGGVLLRRDRLQGLQVPELEGGRTLRNDVRGFFQAFGRVHFSLGGYHLRNNRIEYNRIPTEDLIFIRIIVPQ